MPPKRNKDHIHNMANSLRAAHNLNDSIHLPKTGKQHPERKQFFWSFIKKHRGDYSSAWQDEDELEDPEAVDENGVSWKLAFMSLWEAMEIGKVRLNAQEYAAMKAEAKLAALPPSMRGDTIVPAEFVVAKWTQAELKQMFSGRNITILFLRYSGTFGDIPKAKLSITNQFRDHQAMTGRNNELPVSISVSGTSFAAHKFPQKVAARVRAIAKLCSKLTIFCTGLEGFIGTQPALAHILSETGGLDTTTIVLSLFPLERQTCTFSDDIVEISPNGINFRYCVEFKLKDIAADRNGPASPRVKWLWDQWHQRVIARNAAQLPEVTNLQRPALASGRAAASLSVSRHVAYGAMEQDPPQQQIPPQQNPSPADTGMGHGRGRGRGRGYGQEHGRGRGYGEQGPSK